MKYFDLLKATFWGFFLSDGIENKQEILAVMPSVVWLSHSTGGNAYFGGRGFAYNRLHILKLFAYSCSLAFLKHGAIERKIQPFFCGVCTLFFVECFRNLIDL